MDPPGFCNRFHIHNFSEIVYVSFHEIRFHKLPFCPCLLHVHSLHIIIARSDKCISTFLNDRGHVAISGSAMGRVVFEATVRRRIVRRRDDNTIS